MKRLSFPVQVGRTAVLALLLAGLYALDFIRPGIAPVTHQAPLALLGMAAIDAAVLSLAIRAARGQGWRLATAVFPAYLGVKTLLVAVEAFYLPDVLPPALVWTLLVNGVITAVVTVPAAVWLNGRWRRGAAPLRRQARSLRSWAGRLLLTGFIWTVLFVAVGMWVFQPIATLLDGETAVAYLDAFDPENPMAILAGQWARGILWALLALPLLHMLYGRTWRNGLILGLLFAGLMGSSMLLPNDLLPTAIRPAHAVEVVLENFIFGMVVAVVCGRSHPRPLPAPSKLVDAAAGR